MQYSTLRVSVLVAVFSASTALAFLDCGGGRAPPKTTVPGCPGYVDPTAASSVTITTLVVANPTSLASSGSHSEISGNIYACACWGSLCEYAEPGCVSIGNDGGSSTITASPTKSFGVNEYITSAAESMSTKASISTTTKSPASANTTAKPSTSADTTTKSSTSADTTAISTMSTVVSTIVNTTSTANTTAPKTSGPAATGSPNGASKASGLSSLAIIAVFGMGAMAWL